MPAPTRHKRRRYAAPIGGLFILLALVGLAAVVIASILLTGRVLDNSRERAKLESILRPLVMFDPVPFERVTDIDGTQILYYCMWHVLLNTPSVYDENQERRVPSSDLDNAATTLFGPEVTLEHRTFGDYDLTYFYNQTKQSYSVPTWALLYLYSPQVESIERDGEYYRVLVGYLPPSGYTVDFRGDRENPKPDKYMVYIMRKAGNGYQVVSVRDDERSAGQTHAGTPVQNAE